MTIDPERDLVLERVVQLPAERIWRAWTEPELIVQWFCPKPWETIEAVVDLRPGGGCHTVMRSPEGELFPDDGCYLEVEPNRKLTWTSALTADFRPAVASPHVPFQFTATILLEPCPEGTRYTALARHATPEAAAAHAAMGFQVGWGICLDQLVALMSDAPAS